MTIANILYKVVNLLFGALALFLYINEVEAQNKKYTVSGYVINRDREPISFAFIKEENNNINAFANWDGFYKLELDAVRDSVVLVFSSMGYHTVRKSILLKSNIKLNIELGEASNELEEISIIANTKKKSNTQKIDASKLDNLATPNASVESIVSTLSGVSQRDEMSNQYTVRGGNFDENLIYINGVKIYKSLLVRSSEQEGLSMINPDLVSSIDFSAGGFSVEYDDKISSLLDIKYRKPKAFELKSQISLIENRLSVGINKNKWSLISGIRFKKPNSILSSLDTKAEYDPAYFDAQSIFEYKFDNNWSISALANLNISSYVVIPKIRETNFGTLQNAKKLKVYFDGMEKDLFQNYLAAISLKNVSNDGDFRQNLSISTHYNRESETYDIANEYILSSDDESFLPDYGEYPLNKNTKPLGIRSNLDHARNRLNMFAGAIDYSLSYQINNKNLLKLGANISYESVSEISREWTMVNDYGYTYPNTNDSFRFSKFINGENKLNSIKFSLFASDRFTISYNKYKINILAGLRSSYQSFNREFLFSPRLRIDIKNDDWKNLSLYSNLGIYYQSPLYKEARKIDYNSISNSNISINRNIKSMGSMLFLLGSQYDFTMLNRKFRFSAESYFKYLFNINPYTINNLKLTYLAKNSGSGFLYGIDMNLFGEFVEGVDSWLSIGFLQGKQKIKNVELPFNNAPVYNLSLFFSDYFPLYKAISLSMKGTLMGALPVFIPEDEFRSVAFLSTPYRRVDIGISYRISNDANSNLREWAKNLNIKSLDIGFDIYNLFDISNTASYFWVNDSKNNRWAVPNFLSKRTYNFSIKLAF